MTSQTGEQTIAIHMLINIARSNCNQAIKFDQLIEYSKRNIFIDISYAKCVGDTRAVLYRLFLLYATLRSVKIYGN